MTIGEMSIPPKTGGIICLKGFKTGSVTVNMNLTTGFL